MNLLHNLEEVKRLAQHCEPTPEAMKARMNYIVNLVTILEIHSRNSQCGHFDDRLLEGDFTYNTICSDLSEDIENRKLIRELIEVRNKFVHEGTTTMISVSKINTFYHFVKTVISKRQLVST